jgi:hypothetical protein
MHARTPGSPARQGCRDHACSHARRQSSRWQSSREQSPSPATRLHARNLTESRSRTPGGVLVAVPVSPQHACMLAILHNPHSARPVECWWQSPSPRNTPACSQSYTIPIPHARWQSPSPATRLPATRRPGRRRHSASARTRARTRCACALCVDLSFGLAQFIYYSWNGGRAEAVCAGGNAIRRSKATACMV